MARKWRGGDRVRVRLADGVEVTGRVLRAPNEQREGTAITVDCDDGWRRYVEPARLRPALMLVKTEE